jgi:Zn finger protein HypA/HybF involved in hydrogenase expression
MQERKATVIRKEIESKCYCCDGTGKLCGQNTDNKCPACNGTGVHIESFYYHCSNGICISGDTLK